MARRWIGQGRDGAQHHLIPCRTLDDGAKVREGEGREGGSGRVEGEGKERDGGRGERRDGAQNHLIPGG